MYKILIICFLFVSCVSTREADLVDPMRHFDDCPYSQLTAINVIDLEELCIYRPWAIIKQDGLYYIYDNVNADVIKILNPLRGDVKKGVHQGNGPGEIVSTEGFFKKGKDINLLDGTSMVQYQLETTADSVFLLPVKRYESLQALSNPCFIDNKIISTAFNDSVWIRYYVDTDLKGTIAFPSFDETDKLSDLEKSWAFLSMRFCFRPDGCRAVGAMQSGCLLSILECSDDNIKEVVQYKYYPLVFAATGLASRPIGETSRCRVGFCGLTCSDKYIYALYSGKTMENLSDAFRASYVFVYDWNGNPVKYYHLDKELFGDIGVDEKAGILYGIGYDPEGCIIEYKLN